MADFTQERQFDSFELLIIGYRSGAGVIFLARRIRFTH